MPVEQVKTKVADILSKILKREICDRDLRSDLNLFTELGLDSISVMDFLIEIETGLGVTIEEEVLNASLFEKYQNLESLIVARI